MPTINGTDFLFGADPEVFVKERKSGRFVGAYGLTKGTKQYPCELEGFWGRTLQVDGMALEFNTIPTNHISTFISEISGCKHNIIYSCLNKKELDLVIQPTVTFDDEEWARTPDENKELGCDPDYCAWTLMHNPTPDASVKFRTGAGHIHIGWGQRFKPTEDFLFICGEVAKELDSTLGVASLLFDSDTQRRELYGKAGAFRPKHYGVEYRTLSNWWVSSHVLVEYVGQLATISLRRLMDKAPLHTPEVEDIINNNDIGAAKSFLQYTHTPLPPNQERID